MNALTTLGHTAQMGSIAPTLGDIERAEHQLLSLAQVPMPLTHLFAPGIYWREFFVPAGTFVIGHEHRTEHLNVMLTGRMSVFSDGKMQELTSPCVFMSGAGVRKVAVVHEDMRYATIHPLAGLETCGQNVEQLEAALCVKSETFRRHEQNLLKEAV